MSSDEPLLTENDKRFVLFPIHYHSFQSMYKKAVSCFWIPDEISFTSDLNQLKELNETERQSLMLFLAFFASSDGIVNENVAINFYSEIQSPEARNFYGFQIAMENIHNETYSLMIDTYSRNQEEKDYLFNAIRNIPIIKNLANWAFKFMSRENKFAKRVVAFACYEGIVFSGPFCIIFWFKEKRTTTSIMSC